MARIVSQIRKITQRAMTLTTDATKAMTNIEGPMSPTSFTDAGRRALAE
jgi:hypothetical protein